MILENRCVCGHVWTEEYEGRTPDYCPSCLEPLTGRWVKRNRQDHFQLSIESRIVEV